MDAAPFSENYAKLYFDAKHLEKGLNGGGEIFGGLFSTKVAFWPILDAARIYLIEQADAKTFIQFKKQK